MKTVAAPTNQRSAVTARTALRIAIVATAYIISARVGLSLDAVGGFATVVWPASGIALAAILLGGYVLWPAIAIGALVANILTGATPVAAAGIAIGNTAEALIGAYLLRRVPGFRSELDRVRDVLALLILAAALSTVVSASIGVATLYAVGIMSAAEVRPAWQAWWIGDSIGDLLAAPFILVWAGWKVRWPLPRIGESLALMLVIALAGILVFGGAPAAGSVLRGREYLLFPPLIWAALRFGTKGSVTSAAIVAVIAVVYTALGRGPFVRGQLHDNLLALQLFAGVTGATFLVLGASIAERQKAARDLDAARRVAESANQAKASFLAAVSHELRTPLNAIMGYVDLLLLQIEGALTDRQHDILERVKHSQRHLLALIEDVLGFAQVEAGRLSFVLQPVSVRDSFTTIEKVIGQEIRKKAITLRIADIDSSMFVIADPDKLRQVLLNLVSNAVKFTDPGGAIELSAESADAKVRIDVRDTGIGISRENVFRVFEPFFQVDQGGTRKYPGVGLGLSIVRDAVLAMNGDVQIISEPGKGTTASITLPMTNAVVAAAKDFSLEGGRVSQLDA